jgi:hypothetical protein
VVQDSSAPQFTDVDGDKVVVKTSKGTNAQLAGAVKLVNSGAGMQLREIDFSTVPLVNGVNPFAGTSLTVSVSAAAPTGDGRVHVGYIDASTADSGGMDGAGLPLGKVKIAGDLGQIDVSVAQGAMALSGLAAASMGTFGLATQGANGSGTSNIVGKIGKIITTGDLQIFLNITGTSGGLKVGGALEGASVTFSDHVGTIDVGSVFGSGINGKSAASVKVRGGVPAFGDFMVFSEELTNVKIGGDLFGANIRGGNIRSLFIGGDVRGANVGAASANIVSTLNIGTLTIGGDLVAAGASSSAVIDVAGNLTKLRIGGSIVGAAVTELRQLGASILVDGNVGAIAIGGSIFGPRNGEGIINPRVDSNSSIRVGGDVGSFTVAGSIIGFGGIDANNARNLYFTAKHFNSISIGGEIRGASISIPSFLVGGGDGRPALGRFTVAGSMTNAQIIGGLQDIFVNVPRNADALLGTIVVRGDFAGSKIETGLKGGNITDNPNLDGKLLKLQIGGTLTGTGSVRAEEIVSAKVGGSVLKLTPGKSNDMGSIVFLPGSASIAETA